MKMLMRFIIWNDVYMWYINNWLYAMLAAPIVYDIVSYVTYPVINRLHKNHK